MAVRPIPKFNPDDMHLNLMSSDFGCVTKEQIVDAVVRCIEHNNYQSDPLYLLQCLVELFPTETVERIKAHFNL